LDTWYSFENVGHFSELRSTYPENLIIHSKRATVCCHVIAVNLVALSSPLSHLPQTLLSHFFKSSLNDSLRLTPPYPLSTMYSPTASSNTSLAYHTAYFGATIDANGDFVSFVRKPDDTHKQNGFWRFVTIDDERRAYACGRHTPEDILLAVCRGEGPHDDIVLRWVAGEVEKNMESGISGNATFHLQRIYDIRKYLKKPLAWRGLIPFYPAQPAERMKIYWNSLRAQSKAQERPAGTAAPTQPPKTTSLSKSHTRTPVAHPNNPSPATARTSELAYQRANTAAADRRVQAPPPHSTTGRGTMALTNSSVAGPHNAVRTPSLPPCTPAAQTAKARGNHIPANQNVQQHCRPRCPIAQERPVPALHHGARHMPGQTQNQSPLQSMQQGSQMSDSIRQGSAIRQPTQQGSPIMQPTQQGSPLMQQRTPHTHPSVPATSTSHISGPHQSRQPATTSKQLPASQPTSQHHYHPQPSSLQLGSNNRSRPLPSFFAPLTESSANPQLPPSKLASNLPTQRAQQLAKQHGAKAQLPPANSPPTSMVDPRLLSGSQPYTSQQNRNECINAATPSGIPNLRMLQGSQPYIPQQFPQSTPNGRAGRIITATAPTNSDRTSVPPARKPVAVDHMSSDTTESTIFSSSPVLITRQNNATSIPDQGVQQSSSTAARAPYPVPSPGVTARLTSFQEPVAVYDDSIEVPDYNSTPLLPEVPVNPRKRSTAPTDAESVQRKKLKVIEQQAIPQPPQVENSGSAPFFSEWSGLACMDCGGDTEHKPGCFIGSKLVLSRMYQTSD